MCLIGWIGFRGRVRSKKGSILESIFVRILVDFERKDRGMLALKSKKNRSGEGLEASWRPNPKTRGAGSVFWDPLGAVLGRFLGPSWRLSRRLGATLVVLDPQKIDAKINQFLTASWDRIFKGF